MTEPVFTPVAQRADLEPDRPTRVEAGGQGILLCLAGDDIFAIEEYCSHADQPLCGGRVRAGWIACPAHGTRFDLTTGEPLNPPATTPIRTFPVRVTGDTIEVAI